MWQFAGVSEVSEDETMMEMHSADTLYSALKCLMHAILTEHKDAQQDAEHRMITIRMPWMIRRSPGSQFAHGRPLVGLLEVNAHLVDLEWTKDKQAKLKSIVERYTSWGASAVYRVHR
jgi:hypothetical protein